MANKRIKDISTASTSFASDDFVITDSATSGTRKMTKDNLISQVSAGVSGDYLEESNNLSDVASKDTAKLNLEIGNIGTAANEVPVNGMLGDLAFQSSAGVVVDDLTVDGHFSGTVGKPMPVNGPSMRFDGVSDVVAFAAPVGSAFSFTNGTDDTAFSASFWVKMADLNTNGLVAKYGSSTATQEWGITTTSVGKLQFIIKDSSGRYHLINSESSALNKYLGKWVFITVTYAGAGPNSSNSFAFANVGMQLHINAQAIAVTNTSSSSYGGMSSTNQAVTLGQYFSTAFTLDGEIRDVKLFNKELSAAEVREVYSNGQLPESFAESTGAIAYAQDSTPSGEWSATNVTASDEAGPISGRSNILKLLVSSGNSTHYVQDAKLTSEKRFKVTGSYYIPSSNSNADGFRVGTNTSTDLGVSISAATLDAWTDFSCEFTSNAVNLRISLSDGGSQTFDDSGGNDAAYFDNIRVTQIGSVLDARAENYNQSAGKLLDVSGNDFVGTQSGGVTLLTPRSHLSAGTLDLTNLPTTASGLSAGEVYNDSGTLKIV
jgi:hypothetical protein